MNVELADKRQTLDATEDGSEQNKEAKSFSDPSLHASHSMLRPSSPVPQPPCDIPGTMIQGLFPPAAAESMLTTGMGGMPSSQGLTGMLGALTHNPAVLGFSAGSALVALARFGEGGPTGGLKDNKAVPGVPKPYAVMARDAKKVRLHSFLSPPARARRSRCYFLWPLSTSSIEHLCQRDVRQAGTSPVLGHFGSFSAVKCFYKMYLSCLPPPACARRGCCDNSFDLVYQFHRAFVPRRCASGRLVAFRPLLPL